MLSNIFKGLGLIFLMARDIREVREERKGRSGDSDLTDYFFNHSGSFRRGRAPRHLLDNVSSAFLRGEEFYRNPDGSEVFDMSLVDVRGDSVHILSSNKAVTNDIARKIGFEGPYVVRYDSEDPVYGLRDSVD